MKKDNYKKSGAKDSKAGMKSGKSDKMATSKSGKGKKKKSY